IRNDGVFPQKLAHQFQRGVLVALGLDQHIQNLALGVDGAPQVNHAPIDFQINLVKMPDRMRFGTALAQLRCNDRPEMIYPASDCFVRNCNPALGEQILDVTKAKREPEIEPDRLVNDLRREPISGVADFLHALWLPSRRRRDNARQPHRALDDGAPRPDFAHAEAQRAAEFPDEPCALLRRRLSRPDLRPRTRRLHGPRWGLRESRLALHAAHRWAML